MAQDESRLRTFIVALEGVFTMIFNAMQEWRKEYDFARNTSTDEDNGYGGLCASSPLIQNPFKGINLQDAEKSILRELHLATKRQGNHRRATEYNKVLARSASAAASPLFIQYMFDVLGVDVIVTSSVFRST